MRVSDGKHKEGTVSRTQRIVSKENGIKHVIFRELYHFGALSPVDLRKALPPQRATEDGLFPMTTYFEDYVLREDVLGNVKHFSIQFS